MIVCPLQPPLGPYLGYVVVILDATLLHVPPEPFVYVSSYYIMRSATFRPLLLLQFKAWPLHHISHSVSLPALQSCSSSAPGSRAKNLNRAIKNQLIFDLKQQVRHILLSFFVNLMRSFMHRYLIKNKGFRLK